MAERRAKQHGLLFHLLDVLFNVVVIVAIVAGIRTFIVSPFQVEGGSMNDTLFDKEYIIINKFTYLFDSPHRGDVVVFRPPSDHEKYYVKRVIGVPGDEVIIEGGEVYLREKGDADVHKLEEGYLNDRNTGRTFRHPPSSGDKSRIAYEVPEGTYFLLGDNRQGSLDSRSFMNGGTSTPFVIEEDIKGRVWFVALPITKIHVLESVDYGF